MFTYVVTDMLILVRMKILSIKVNHTDLEHFENFYKTYKPVDINKKVQTKFDSSDPLLISLCKREFNYQLLISQ